ncbi:radial spoke protein 1 [Achlya hypogyna]|uniref:Radial spoke protein 1 n=1 Tax=Achlya hypogyna TaxID=1202772 RepID=A0A1V9Z956_ACHHY|nr:radial spoke protein 1 [Achlya hypogyna]
MNVVYDVGSWRLTQDGRIYRRGKQRFANGDLYDGEWLEGVREGRGTFTYVSGAVYQGEFAQNLFHGFGSLRVPDTQHPLTKAWVKGSSYEGSFACGRKSGKGTLVHGDGSSYDGNFADDVFSGHGVLCYANGDRYDGDWKHGQWWGRGHLLYRDGGSYDGDFHAGQFHGCGRRTWPHRLGSYVGEYRMGRQHGTGVRVFADGSQFDGAWLDDRQHGSGVWTTDDFVYIGDFEAGKPHGNGLFRYENGDVYEGQVHSGFWYGRGKLCYKDGGYYDGDFAAVRVYRGVVNAAPNNKRHGKGRRVWSNGHSYDGEWSQDVMHGRGTLTSLVEGMKVEYVGAFSNGRQTGDGTITLLKTTTGPLEFPLGSGNFHVGKGVSMYTGGFFNGAFHGQGTFIFTDGRRYIGAWRHGKRSGKGEAHMIPTADCGDERRLYIRGKDALYRVAKYVGDFNDDVREGHGTIFYSNGESVEGQFVGGHVHGRAKYTFATKKTRWGTWQHGTRVAWDGPSNQDDEPSKLFGEVVSA